jgi:aminopeptidase
MRDPRITKLADVLVNYSVGVKPGQSVRITGDPVCTPLVLELYRKILESGGYPLVRMVPEDLKEISLKHGSDEQLTRVDPIALYEIQNIDCSIHIWGEENTRQLSNINPKRLGLSESARKPLFDVFLKRAAEGKLRWSGTQFPTQGCAQDAEMSLMEYEDFVFSAGLLNEPNPAAAWRKMSQAQQRLADYLNGKSDYRVVAANGTDIRLSVANHRWINCDGHENFPDGEVFSGPVLDSVNGTVNFSFPAVHHGREVQDVRLQFRDGKVVDASASKGEDFLFSMLNSDGGSRFLGECAIGTNYNIRRYTKNTLFDEKIGGTVHFALGAGYPETGNSNQSGLHWDMVVDLRTGGYVEIDGVKISEDGKFTKEGFPVAS